MNFIRSTLVLLGLQVFYNVNAIVISEKEDSTGGINVLKKAEVSYKPVDQSFFDEIKSRMESYTLKNGLEVVLFKDTRMPKVFMAMGYRVGSANEDSKTRGMAHLLEHMIFKGTDKISESDIWHISSKYGADLNAWTSLDLTYYFFQVDKANWKPFLSILADCSQNLRCEGQHLASELKAVVQELKMRRDDVNRIFWNQILQKLLPANHPYFNPTLGYIQELAAMDPAELKKFYKEHYRTPNATLFVFGDIDTEAVKAAIEENFGSIPSQGTRNQISFPPVIKEPVLTQTTVCHEIGVPKVCLAWVISGLKDREKSLLGEVCASVLVNEQSGRLQKLLVDDLKLALSVSVGNESICNNGIFIIDFSCQEQNIDKCVELIQKELLNLSSGILEQDELDLAKATVQNKIISSFESYPEMGFGLFSHLIATSKDPRTFFDDPAIVANLTTDDAQQFFTQEINPIFFTKVTVLPVNEQTRPTALAAQEAFREEEEQILKNHVRTVPLEGPKLAKTLGEPNLVDFSFPKPTTVMTLDNGLKVIALDRKELPQVSCALRSRDQEWLAKSLKGNVLFDITNDLLLENSVGYSKEENSELFNTLGAQVSFSSVGANLKVTTPNLTQALDHLFYVVSNPEFRSEDLQKLVVQKQARYTAASKSASKVCARLKNSILYPATEFDWTFDQAIELCTDLSLDQVQQTWTEFLVPQNLVLVLVGNLPAGWEDAVKNTFGIMTDLRTNSTEHVVPAICPSVDGQTAEQELANDQKRLLFIRPNTLTIKDDNSILVELLNTIVLAGAASELFALREQTGLFYTAGGVFGADPNDKDSFDSVVTLVNPKNVPLFTSMLWQMFDKVTQNGVDPEKFAGAKQAFLNDMMSALGENGSLASKLLYLEIHNLGWDYLDRAMDLIKSCTIEDINTLAKQYCNSSGWATIQVGGQI